MTYDEMIAALARQETDTLTTLTDAELDEAIRLTGGRPPLIAEKRRRDEASATTDAHDLIPPDVRAALLANGDNRYRRGHDPIPVVKWFTPDAQATWIITELDPDDPDIAFGLCDPGLGFPELGSVSVAELLAVRGPLGLRIERDLHFRTDYRLSAWTDAARRASRILDPAV